jgi:hypothetical protein
MHLKFRDGHVGRIKGSIGGDNTECEQSRAEQSIIIHHPIFDKLHTVSVRYASESK